MARPNRDEEDTLPRRRRRREAAPGRTWLIVGVSLAGVAVAVAAVVLIANARAKRNVERVTTEGGVIVTTVKSSDGGSTITHYGEPVDGRPYGMRHDDKSHRPDQAVLTEAWGMLKGRWERTGPKGETYVAEFRDDYTATVTLVHEVGGVRTSDYRLKSVSDDTFLIPRDKSVKRAYSLYLRPVERPEVSIDIDCVILQNGTLSAGHRETKPYQRIR